MIYLVVCINLKKQINKICSYIYPLLLQYFAGDNNQPEALNKKALAIITRVRDKLTGRDFSHEETLSVRRQVDLLIQQATNNENLCQCYIGWYVILNDIERSRNA